MINFSYGLSVGVSIVCLLFSGLLIDKVNDNVDSINKIEKRLKSKGIMR
jgi:hypothetical protein